MRVQASRPLGRALSRSAGDRVAYEGLTSGGPVRTPQKRSLGPAGASRPARARHGSRRLARAGGPRPACRGTTLVETSASDAPVLLSLPRRSAHIDPTSHTETTHSSNESCEALAKAPQQ